MYSSHVCSSLLWMSQLRCNQHIKYECEGKGENLGVIGPVDEWWKRKKLWKTVALPLRNQNQALGNRWHKHAVKWCIWYVEQSSCLRTLQRSRTLEPLQASSPVPSMAFSSLRKGRGVHSEYTSKFTFLNFPLLLKDNPVRYVLQV